MFASKRIGNFSSPGSGKTIVSFMSILSEYVENGINVLLVAGPKSASNAWMNEWKIITSKKKIDINLLDFSNKSNFLSYLDNAYLARNTLNIIFINYHKFTDDFLRHFLRKVKDLKYGIILDEVHYLKNCKSIKFGVAQSLSKNAKFVYLLTGTPIPRKIEETKYITNILWPNTKRDHLKDEDFLNYNYNCDNDFNKELKNKFSKIYVKKDKENLVKKGELKRLKIINIEIPMNTIEKYLNNELRKYHENILDLKNSELLLNALLIRRMQASSYPKLLSTSLKQAIEEIEKEEYDYKDLYSDNDSNKDNVNDKETKKIEEYLKKVISDSKFKKMIELWDPTKSERWLKALELINKHNNERIIIWDVFKNSSKDFIRFIKTQIKRKIFYINGDIVGDERKNELKKFRLSENGILIASPATIAESVSLHHEVDVAIYLFRNYVGSHWMQSQDRIHRLVKPGEETNLKTAYVILTKGKDSIDQAIDENLTTKDKTQKSFIIET